MQACHHCGGVCQVREHLPLNAWPDCRICRRFERESGRPIPSTVQETSFASSSIWWVFRYGACYANVIRANLVCILHQRCWMKLARSPRCRYGPRLNYTTHTAARVLSFGHRVFICIWVSIARCACMSACAPFLFAYIWDSKTFAQPDVRPRSFVRL